MSGVALAASNIVSAPSENSKNTEPFSATEFGADRAAFADMAKNLFSPQANGQYLFYSNLCFVDNAHAGILDGKEVSPELRHAIELLHCRLFLTTDGNLVLPQKLAEKMQAFSNIAQDLGWVSKGAFERVVFVEDIFQLDKSLAAISKSKPDCTIVPYGASSNFVQVANKHGLSVQYADQQTCDLASEYGDKTFLKDLVARIQLSMGQTPQPRAAFYNAPYPQFANSDFQVLQGILQVTNNYHQQIHQGDNSKPLMFLQISDSGGGFGNYRIFKDSKSANGYIVKTGNGAQDLSFNNVYELGFYIGQLRAHSNIELAPFLKISNTFSYGVMVTDITCAVLGCREQILNREQGYNGFRLTCKKPETDLERQSELLSLQLAAKLQTLGYRGPFGIDFMVYTDSEGQECLGVAEINARFDATTALTQWVLKNQELEQALYTGQLAIMQHDYIRVPLEVAHDTAGLVQVLKDSGINLFQPDTTMPSYNDEGVVLLSPLWGDINNKTSRVLLGVIAKSDEMREKIFAATIQALKVSL